MLEIWKKEFEISEEIRPLYFVICILSFRELSRGKFEFKFYF